MTNLGKTREELIFDLVLSLNQGRNSYPSSIVDIAISQYEDLVSKGIIKVINSSSKELPKDI